MWLSSFIFGLIFGSFANVVIYRLKSGEPIGFSRSFCPRCKTILKWYDLIPLLSFLWLEGKCRYCREKISWQYPVVEILSGFIWVGAFYQNFNENYFTFGGFPVGEQLLNVFYQIFILSVMLIVAAYDARWKIIPDKIIYPAIFAAVLYGGIGYSITGNFRLYFSNPLLAATTVFLFFYAIYFFSRGKAMGLGDAKLGILIGLFLRPSAAFFAILAAFLIGAFYGIILLAGGRKSLQDKVSFGPFLAIGTFLAFFFYDYVSKIFNLNF